jgi:hypothetical protein
MFCIQSGKPFIEKLQRVAKDCKAVIAWGSCASWGCVQAAKPNPTQATPIHKVITDKPIIKVPGCPPIAEVMTGVITYMLTFDKIPELDRQGRPKMFYSQRIHDKCYRRPHFDAGQFVEAFDDERAQGLLPLQGRLQGPDHLQRLLHGDVERGHELPDQGRPRLHRLLGRRLLGQGLVLRPPDHHPPVRRRRQRRQDRWHRRRRGGCRGGCACRRLGRQAPEHEARPDHRRPSAATPHRRITEEFPWASSKPRASSSTTPAAASWWTRSPASKATCAAR